MSLITGCDHLCNIRCKAHQTRAKTCSDISTDYADCAAGEVPGPPAFNKFNKIFPQLSFFTAFVHIPAGLSVEAYQNMSRKKLSGHTAKEDAQLLADGADYMDSKQYCVRERVRLRKSCGFVSAEAVHDKALCCTLCLKVVLNLLGSTFSESRVVNDDSGGPCKH